MNEEKIVEELSKQLIVVFEDLNQIINMIDEHKFTLVGSIIGERITKIQHSFNKVSKLDDTFKKKMEGYGKELQKMADKHKEMMESKEKGKSESYLG